MWGRRVLSLASWMAAWLQMLEGLTENVRVSVAGSFTACDTRCGEPFLVWSSYRVEGCDIETFKSTVLRLQNIPVDDVSPTLLNRSKSQPQFTVSFTNAVCACAIFDLAIEICFWKCVVSYTSMFAIHIKGLFNRSSSIAITFLMLICCWTM